MIPTSPYLPSIVYFPPPSSLYTLLTTCDPSLFPENHVISRGFRNFLISLFDNTKFFNSELHYFKRILGISHCMSPEGTLGTGGFCKF